MYYDTETNDKKADKKLLQRFAALGYNIAEELEDDELHRIGSDAISGYGIDKDSRVEKEERWRLGQTLAKQTIEKKNTPFENASNVKYPLITVAAIQFAARAYPSIIRNDEIAKCKVIGKDDDDQKQKRGENACKYMNWQLLSEMPEWESDTDKLLLMLSLYGDMFRKTWFSPSKQRPASKILRPDNLVVNASAQSIELAPRISEEFELYPNEIESRIRSGIFIPFQYGEDTEDKDASHLFIEQYCDLDLDEDGYKEPYIVTVHKETHCVCRIVANYQFESVEVNSKGRVAKIAKRDYFTHYVYIPSTDGSFYNLGFFDVLYPLNESINTTLNQLFDAGALANSNTGFVASGLRIGKGFIQAKIGRYQAINASGDDIRKGIVTMTFPGPSQALFNLLVFLIDAAKEVANLKDVLTGENQGVNQPVGTTLALIEQGMQVFGSVFKRVHRAIGKELQILKDINAEYLNPQQYLAVLDAEVTPEDFKDDDIDYIPVSDPQVVTSMQKLSRAQFVGQFANDPFFNPIEVRKRMLEAANVEDIENLIIPPSDQPSFEQRLAMMEAENEQKRLALDMRKLDIEEMKARTDEMSKKAGAIKDLAEAESKEVGSQISAYTAQTESLRKDRQQFIDQQEAQEHAANERGLVAMES